MIDILSTSAEQTIHIGACLGASLQPGDLVLLLGGFGVGKTHLVKGVAQGLGSPDLVTSPSFVLINQYRAGPAYQGMPIYHVDLYRIDNPLELTSIGLEETWSDQGVCLVEWAEHAQDVLPDDHLTLKMEHAGDQERRLVFEPHGRRYVTLVEHLTAMLAE